MVKPARRVILLSLAGKEIPASVYKHIKKEEEREGQEIQLAVFNTSFTVDFYKGLDQETNRLKNHLCMFRTQRDEEWINCFSPCESLYFIPPTLNVLSVIGYELLSSMSKKPNLISVRRDIRSERFEFAGSLAMRELYQRLRGQNRQKLAKCIAL